MIHQLRFSVSPIGDPLHFCCRLNTNVIWSDRVVERHEIAVEFDDSEGTQHCLELELSGKQNYHTKLDSLGNIERDSVLMIADPYIDDINLDYIFYKTCVYMHDCNGTQPAGSYDFWGQIGCNGTVSFNWHSPFYLWYLQSKNQ